MTTEHISLTCKALVRYKKFRRLPKAQGERVFILGNGPSLSEALANHMHVLSSSPVFCVNFFANSMNYPALKPLYYGMMDPVFSLQNCFPRVQERRKKIFDTIMEVTDWDMHMFFPLYPGQMELEKHLDSPKLHMHICNIFPSFKIPLLRNPIYKTGLMMPPPPKCVGISYIPVH